VPDFFTSSTNYFSQVLQTIRKLLFDGAMQASHRILPGIPLRTAATSLFFIV
jgi:hypothetical protein